MAGLARGGALLLIAACAASAAGAAPSSLPAPTVIRASPATVDFVARDATHVAWCVGQTVHVMTLPQRIERTQTVTRGNCISGASALSANGGIAMAGVSDVHGGGVFYEVSVLSGGRIGVVADPTIEYGGPGSWYRGLAAAGGNFYFTILHVEADDNFALGTCPCRFTVTGGGVYRIAGTRPRLLKKLPLAAAIAGGDGLLALVEPLKSWTGDGADGTTFPRAATDGRIEVRRTSNDRLVTSFRSRGIVRAVAISRRHLVLVVKRGGVFRMEWRDPTTGRQQGAVTLPGTVESPSSAFVSEGASNDLSTSGDLAVALHGHSDIWAIDLRTGKLLSLDRGAVSVIGLSVVGRRLVWGETTGHRSRIFELSIPSS